jgi:hypothetical protein
MQTIPTADAEELIDMLGSALDRWESTPNMGGEDIRDMRQRLAQIKRRFEIESHRFVSQINQILPPDLWELDAPWETDPAAPTTIDGVLGQIAGPFYLNVTVIGEEDAGDGEGFIVEVEYNGYGQTMRNQTQVQPALIDAIAQFLDYDRGGQR